MDGSDVEPAKIWLKTVGGIRGADFSDRDYGFEAWIVGGVKG